MIRRGRLPLRPPDKMFGGAGSGEVCPVCGEVAARHQLELEIEFHGHGVVDKFHLHPSCFAAWEFERTKVASSVSYVGGDDPGAISLLIVAESSRRVLPEGLAGWSTMAYSITRSARSRIDGGIVSPKASAVLRLIINSNLVGCSTGKSLGRAPLRILST